MFIVTTTPERPTKLRRSGTQGNPPRPSGSVRANSNTCRSYGAWPAAARLAIDMALLTELSATPPLLPHRAKNACKEQRGLPQSKTLPRPPPRQETWTAVVLYRFSQPAKGTASSGTSH